MWLALVVVLVATVCGLALGLLVHWRGGTERPRRPGATSASLDPAELHDVAALLDSADRDARRNRDQVLVARVRPLVDKRVPLSVVEPVPGLQTVRLRFADGTALVGYGERAGDAGVLASMVLKQPVWVGSFTTDLAGTHLRFPRAGNNKPVAFVVTGLDQPE